MSNTIFAGHVVPSVSIDNLVNQRNAVLERLRAALALIWEAEGIARHSMVGMPRLVHETRGDGTSLYARMRYTRHSRVNTALDEPDEPDIDRDAILHRIAKDVDSKAWQSLMSESGLKTFMDTETRRQWDERIYKGEVPELTHENIEATFQSLYLNRHHLLEDGVVKCFQRLSWCYKTNQPFRFGPKIILRGFSEYNHKRCEELDDLVRVFHVLEGRPEPDHRNGMYQYVARAYGDPAQKRCWPKICDTEYLHIKLFKNQNAHITFKRADVVDSMNQMIARRYPGALPYDRRGVGS